MTPAHPPAHAPPLSEYFARSSSSGESKSLSGHPTKSCFASTTRCSFFLLKHAYDFVSFPPSFPYSPFSPDQDTSNCSSSATELLFLRNTRLTYVWQFFVRLHLAFPFILDRQDSRVVQTPIVGLDKNGSGRSVKASNIARYMEVALLPNHF